MITKEIQQQLFEEYGTPAHVQAHCNEVARVSVLLAKALNVHGYDLDLDIVEGAAFVHDLVRTEENHALRGGEILAELGYAREAEIVKNHMTYNPFSDTQSDTEIMTTIEKLVSEFNEQDVVCIADRTVCEDQYVGVDKRVDYLITKPGFPKEATEHMEQVRKQNKALVKKLEEVIGISFEELFKKPAAI